MGRLVSVSSSRSCPSPPRNGLLFIGPIPRQRRTLSCCGCARRRGRARLASCRNPIKGGARASRSTRRAVSWSTATRACHRASLAGGLHCCASWSTCNPSAHALRSRSHMPPCRPRPTGWTTAHRTPSRHAKRGPSTCSRFWCRLIAWRPLHGPSPPSSMCSCVTSPRRPRRTPPSGASRSRRTGCRHRVRPRRRRSHGARARSPKLSRSSRGRSGRDQAEIRPRPGRTSCVSMR